MRTDGPAKQSVLAPIAQEPMPAVTIDLPPEAHAQFRCAAEQEGIAPETFAREALIAAAAERVGQPSPEELHELSARWDERDASAGRSCPSSSWDRAPPS